MAVAHDCATAGCEGPALRAHQGRVAQGKPAVATLESDGVKYHNTAVILRAHLAGLERARKNGKGA